MPIIPYEEATGQAGLTPLRDLKQPTDTLESRSQPPLLDLTAAALRQNNSAANVPEYLRGIAATFSDSPDERDFDPLADEELAGFEEYADRFIGAATRAQSRRIKDRIRQELADRKTLAQGGAGGLVASIAAGLVDPVTLVSMAVPVAGAGTRLARVGKMVGASAALDSAQEVALHGEQELRTLRESALNIGAGALLTGALGTLATRVPRAEFQALRTRLESAPHRSGAPPSMEAVDSTAGAAQVARTTRADETLATAGAAGLSATVGQVAPATRLLHSPSVSARRLVQELVETPELLEKNLRGVATPTAIETLLKRNQGAFWQSYQARTQLFREYRVRMKAAGERPLSRAQFWQEVAFAKRRGDVSPIPEVAQAAQRSRALVNEPLKRRAIRLGLLPEDVKASGAASYEMRMYNVARIRREQSAWIETLTDGFERQGIDRVEAETIAYQVTRNILGSERGTLDLRVLDDVAPKSGRLAERQLKLPDGVLEPWLVNDIDALELAYLRTLAPEIELTERLGDRHLDDALSKVRDEYGVLKGRATEARNDRLLKTLTQREESDLQDLRALRDRLYGHFGAPKDPASFFVRAGRAVRAVNYVRLLGGQLISAFTDPARMMMIYGAPRLMSSALRLASSVKALKLTRDAARRMGVGLDMVLNTRGIALGDIGEYSSFAEQKALRGLSDAFSIISLQSPWNAVLKSWASVMSQDDFLAAAAKSARGQGLTKFERARLASLALDEDMLARIGAQAAEHGQVHQGLRFGNSDQWTDQGAARAFEAAVLREVDTAILTPGAGDLPLLYSTEWGKALLQFKSFGLSSMRRLVIPAVQGASLGDLRTMTGVVSSFGFGALVYVLKQLAADRPIETDPKRFAMEMVDKSGLLGWTGDILFPSLWQAGADDLSRWSDRQPVETLLGPVAGTIGDVYASRWPAKVFEGDLSASDVHKVRRLLPFQNLFYLRRAINELEEQAAEAVAVQ